MTRIVLVFLIGLAAGVAVWLLFLQPEPAPDVGLPPEAVTRLPADAPETAGPDERDQATARNDALKTALAKLERIPGYRGVFSKRERIRGSLIPEESMEIKLRHEPFAVYLKFVAPQGKAGREVIYGEGLHEGNMLVHEAGLLAWAGTIRVKPDSDMALAASRRPITNIGLKNLVKKMLAGDIAIEGKATVTVTDDTVDGRPTKLYESHVLDRADDEEISLSRVWIDDQWQVPVRFQGYGWPEEDGNRPLIEHYEYTDLDFDVDLGPIDFDPANPDYEYQ